MNQENNKNIIYEHPMNERVRNLLRIEHLYNIIGNCSKEDSEYNCREILRALLQISGLLVRSDMKNEIIKGCLLTHKGEIIHELTRQIIGIKKYCIFLSFTFLVRSERLELSRETHTPLKRACLPISARPHILCDNK